MLVLGLQGSPRKNGNTTRLLERFLAAAGAAGAQTTAIRVSRENILPCRGCGYCEKKGHCIIDDDFMAQEGYQLLRQADVIVAATPVFFYNMTAQLKALVDRTQALWSRKYCFKVKDPSAGHRKGILLSVGASSGKTLFDAIELSTRYFFDAVCAGYAGALTYRGVEAAGDLEKIPGVAQEIEQLVSSVVRPLATRKKILVVGARNEMVSWMAAVLLQQQGGRQIEVRTAGLEPAERIHPDCITALQEIGIDLAWEQPVALKAALSDGHPDLVIRMTDRGLPSMPTDSEDLTWRMPGSDTAGGLDALRRIREGLHVRTREFLTRRGWLNRTDTNHQ